MTLALDMLNRLYLAEPPCDLREPNFRYWMGSRSLAPKWREPAEYLMDQLPRIGAVVWAVARVHPAIPTGTFGLNWSRPGVVQVSVLTNSSVAGNFRVRYLFDYVVPAK